MSLDYPPPQAAVPRRAGSIEPKAHPGLIDRLSTIASRLQSISQQTGNTLNAIRGPVPEAVGDLRTSPQAAPTLQSVASVIERQLEEIEAQARELSQAF